MVIGWTANSTDTTQDRQFQTKMDKGGAWLTESYKRVQVEPSDVSMSLSTCSTTSECVSPCWKRSRNCAAVWSPDAAKQGSVESFRGSLRQCRTRRSRRRVVPFCMSSTIVTILSQCFRAASNPSWKSLRNSRNGSPSTPPNNSTYSRGNLNGAASNPMFPGELDSMNPKSI